MIKLIPLWISLAAVAGCLASTEDRKTDDDPTAEIESASTAGSCKGRCVQAFFLCIRSTERELCDQLRESCLRGCAACGDFACAAP